jgi:murein DD-endopeptidase MepM/ murein hydrolase activator NlpD
LLLPDLLRRQPGFAPILPPAVLARPLVLDFTARNRELDAVELKDTQRFSNYVFGKLWAHDATVGVGGYGEERVLYRRSPHFAGTGEARTVHLGVDLWAEAGTPVFAPLSGVLHSAQDNAGFGDYGPTLILEHRLVVPAAPGRPPGILRFYSLYGHLSRASLRGRQAGTPVAAGERLGTLGDFPENGDWPPHLHVQLIADVGRDQGDYPGVCAPSERERYLASCPDPNLILRLPALGTA